MSTNGKRATRATNANQVGAKPADRLLQRKRQQSRASGDESTCVFRGEQTEPLLVRLQTPQQPERSRS